MDIFWAGLCISYLYTTLAADLCKFHKFTHEPGYDNVEISDPKVWQLDNIALPQCMWQCLNTTGCFSIQYKAVDQSCMALRKFYSSTSLPPPLPDFKLYNSEKGPESECVNNGDCGGGGNCILGMCYCDSPAVGYSRHGRTCRPLTECVKFTNSFKKFPRHFIWHGDLASYGFSSPAACIQTCISTSGCVNFDFSHVWAMCFPQGIAWLQAPPSDRVTNDGSRDHYQRECDWIATDLLK